VSLAANAVAAATSLKFCMVTLVVLIAPVCFTKKLVVDVALTVLASQVQLVVAAGIVTVQPPAVAPPLPIRISNDAVPFAAEMVELVPPQPPAAIVGSVLEAKLFIN